ncbi:Slp family lipoprotein [Parathalassolituus penaei]|uniref:Slp family lipoprotein n=1 Tax=Parathalassolituus penaei TaxID=2997323 RepID=A0A9X3EFN1_9GAMM|nr:Slp family lipoprotein [Parathalassolituus penaei]MCY0966672.1 Slp family lipoprotein [Parathalassolituus penaei]
MLAKALRLYSSLVVAALMVGCASYPKSIEVADPAQQPGFKEVQANPDQYKGQTLVWGGQIVSVTNKDQSTVLEILQMPLWDTGKPRTERDLVGGRIHAHVPYFLDPEVYASGRLVSVRGTFAGIEAGKIGEHEYSFPTLDVNGIELWPKSQDPEVVYFMDYGFWGPPPPPRSRIFISTPIRR